MHDYHAVKALVARLTGDPTLGTGVTEVRVRASPVYSAEALEQAYEILIAGTALAGSRLRVDGLSEQRSCARCGLVFEVSAELLANHLVICPGCGEPSLLGVEAALELVEISRRPRGGDGPGAGGDLPRTAPSR